MPIYAYACAKCGARFEVLFRRASQGRRVPCESCGSARTERQFSTFAVHGGTIRAGGRGPGSASSCASCRAGTCSTCGR